MSETSRKFSRNSVHKWLKLWKRVLCCCMLLPLMWNHSKTSVFRIARPLHVGRLQQTSPTHQELHTSSLFEHPQFVFLLLLFLVPRNDTKSTQTHAQLHAFVAWLNLTDDVFLTKDWIIFLNCNMCFFYFFDCALHTGLRRRHPAKPFSFNCYQIFFLQLDLVTVQLDFVHLHKKGCLTATWFCLSTTWFA